MQGMDRGRAGGGECCLERVPLTKSSRSKPCSVNEYCEVGGRRSVVRREEVTRKERDAHMIPLRLSIDSRLKASDKGAGQIH